jgi:hypothetical protein
MGKIGKPQICRPTLHRFFFVKKLNKKNNCLKMSTVSTLIDARKFKRKTKTFLCSWFQINFSDIFAEYYIYLASAHWGNSEIWKSLIYFAFIVLIGNDHINSQCFVFHFSNTTFFCDSFSLRAVTSKKLIFIVIRC